ncbi:S41 family peptidase, partial [Fulvivirga lutimaris]|uniref:S41 family peptidase n=1 Tax=Fulvivirga lutimaris TaxID=1819566 RepID=UPI0012BD0307
KSQILEDMAFLKSSLNEAHYNLYAYTSKEAFDKNYNLVKQSIKKDSFNLLEATSLFQKIISKANNGHTEIPFPGKSYGEYAYGGGTVFPLEIAFEDDKALVRKNWSNNERIKVGSEILSINGLAIQEILNKIYPLISAERIYFKNAKLELYSFPRFYWQVFGKQNEFKVEIKSGDRNNTHTIQAVDVIDGYEMKRNEIFHSTMTLKFYDHAAYLRPGGFGGDLEKYKHFIDSAFTEIKKHKSQNLIVDLRNHPGGDDAFGDYLVSYFADRPFKWTSKFTLKTSSLLKEHTRKSSDTTTVYAKEILAHNDGEVFEYKFEECQPQPREKRFTGKVYVLVNRQSYSQSTVTAAQIQDYGFGTIVGEETGEYPTLYASVYYYALPNTGVTVQISKGRIVRVNGSTKEEGLIPDILIKDHLLDENDEILDGLFKRLEE